MSEDLIHKRKQRLERLKRQLSQHESLMKEFERKQRTRRLIELGGLIVKADLDSLTSEQLYGALLEIKELLKTNPQKLKIWEAKGKEDLTKDLKDKTPVIVSFKQKPTQELRDKIRSSGLKWNVFRKEWQGHVILDQLNTILQEDLSKETVLIKVVTPSAV